MRKRTYALTLAVTTLVAGCGGSSNGTATVDYTNLDFTSEGSLSTSESEMGAYCASIKLSQISGDDDALEPNDIIVADTLIEAVTAQLRKDPETKLKNDKKKNRTLRDYAVDIVTELGNDCDPERAAKLQAVIDSTK